MIRKWRARQPQKILSWYYCLREWEKEMQSYCHLLRPQFFQIFFRWRPKTGIKEDLRLYPTRSRFPSGRKSPFDPILLKFLFLILTFDRCNTYYFEAIGIQQTIPFFINQSQTFCIKYCKRTKRNNEILELVICKLPLFSGFPVGFELVELWGLGLEPGKVWFIGIPSGRTPTNTGRI